jgi:5'-3' exoribonuclease 2
MGVLSPLSIKAIPSCLRHLMLDENSNIIDFYPTEFIVDSKGKKFAWLGEVLLPFIEEERLLNAINKHIDELNEEETFRNRKGETLLFVSKENPLIEAFTQKLSSLEDHQKGKIKINYQELKLGGAVDENIVGDDNMHMCFIYYLPPIKV